jgi:hypothetical protein
VSIGVISLAKNDASIGTAEETAVPLGELVCAATGRSEASREIVQAEVKYKAIVFGEKIHQIYPPYS